MFFFKTYILYVENLVRESIQALNTNLLQSLWFFFNSFVLKTQKSKIILNLKNFTKLKFFIIREYALNVNRYENIHTYAFKNAAT